MTRTRTLLAVSILLGLAACAAPSFLPPPANGKSYTIVYQPSHQTDTGVDFNEALVCNAIAEAAIAAGRPGLEIHKVWSHDASGLHHARAGSNTKIEHTSALGTNGAISGYAYEIRQSNRLGPDVFISFHNNGATNKNGCWGFVHEGDVHEPVNRRLAALLVEAVCEVSGLENLGVHGDSEPNRNDYRCATTGKLCFYSLDENVNRAPVRVLLEIGDNAVSREILLDGAMQKAIGQAVQRRLEDVLR